MAHPSLEAWHASGRHRTVRDADGIDRQLFTRVVGEGPWTTFWHGYPSSSWDWAKLDPLLETGRSRLYLDHLGFGASEKPGDHAYSLLEQVDLACQVWEQLGIEETLLVAHDYSVSMVQELLHRQQAGRWDGPKLTGILLMNGGLFYSRIRLRPIQHLLRHWLTGPLVARLVSQGSFERAFTRVFADEHPPSKAELAQHWQAIEMNGGRGAMHRVSQYYDEREAYEERWTQALSQAQIPLDLVWGLEDPVSGYAMFERATEVAPMANAHRLDGVGHYPQWEVPERIASLVAAFERTPEATNDPGSR